MYPKVTLIVHAKKYRLEVRFSCLLVALALFAPTPQLTHSNFGQYVIRSGLISVSTATCMYITLAKQACTLSYWYLLQSC